MTPFDLEVTTTYQGCQDKVCFEIVRWGLQRGKFEPLNNGLGCWNYYIYLFERALTNFSNFWLPFEVKEFSPGGTKYIQYDYYSSPLNVGSWHGGITFWEQGGLDGLRYIKIGCDYNHLWDQEQDYTIRFVLIETIQTIAEILPLLSFR